MPPSLSLTTYLAGLRSGGADDAPDTLAAPVQGPVIWIRCSQRDQLTAAATLARKLSEQGDAVHTVATLQDWTPDMADHAFPEPESRDTIRAFIARWQPVLCIWLHGDLVPNVLLEIRAAGIPRVLVNATAEGIAGFSGSWVPGAQRTQLAQFDTILTLDRKTADQIITAGIAGEVVTVTGPIEDCVATLPCDDTARQSVARAIGTRSVWLAAGARIDEWRDLADAYRIASKRAHRLLLVVVPQNADVAAAYVRNMRETGFRVTSAAEQAAPSEMTQIHITENDDTLGLWYRVAPISYIGGTLHGGGCRDPFEAAALGSATICGPHTAPFAEHAVRLTDAGAARLVRSGDDLGQAVEELLAPDKAAVLAHAAWDVTSQGADAVNRIAGMVRQVLDTDARA